MDKQKQYGFKIRRQRERFDLRRQRRNKLFTENRGSQFYKDPSTMAQEQCYDGQIVDFSRTKQITKILATNYAISQLKQLSSYIFDNSDNNQKQLNEQQYILLKHRGIIGIRKIIQDNNVQQLQQVLQVNKLKHIVTFLKQDKYPQLQFQASLIISSILYSKPKYIIQNVLCEPATIQMMLQLCSCQIKEINQELLTIIVNISCEGPEYRNLIIKNGGFQVLGRIIKYGSIKNKQSYIWALAYLCKGDKLPDVTVLQQPLFILMKYISQNKIKQPYVHSDVCNIIADNMNHTSTFVELVLSSGLLKSIVTCLSHKSNNIVSSNVKILCSLSLGGSSNQISKILKQPYLLDSMAAALKNTRKGIRLQICWILTNFTNSENHINKLLNNKNLFQMVLYVLKEDSSCDVKAEIFRFLGNIAESGDEHVVKPIFKEIDILDLFMSCLYNQETLHSKKLIQSIIKNLVDVLEFNEVCMQQKTYHNQLRDMGFYKIINQFQKWAQAEDDQNFSEIIREFLEKFPQNDQQ